MNILNPFSKDLDKFERGIAVFFDAMIAGCAVGLAFAAELIVWECQDEIILDKEDLVECIHSDPYYSTWVTLEHDTVAVYNKNNVHVHNFWCCRPISCEGTRVLVDQVPVIPTKVKKVQNFHSCTYHWERVRMWNW